MTRFFLSKDYIHTGSLILVNGEYGFVGKAAEELVPIQEQLSSKFSAELPFCFPI